MGNLYPAVDNDDGSQKYIISGNVAVYGGFKNYLGQNKRWLGNLVVFPDRWSGDACLTAWGGEEHVYENNTCVTTNGFPQAFDADVEGNNCVFNYSDAVTAPFLPATRNNVYATPDGSFQTGCQTLYTLAELQALGQEAGSIVVKGYDAAALLAQAAALLQ